MIAAIPAVDLRLGSAPLPAGTLRSLTGVTVMQRLSQPTLCELVFSDPPGRLEAVAALQPGTSVNVRLGGHETELFAGELTGKEHHFSAGGERTLRLRAYDRLHRLRLRQHVRTFAQMDPADIARELLEPLGLEVVVAAGGPMREHVMQYRQSDLELLVRLLDESGLHLRLVGSRAEIFAGDGSGKAVPLTAGENLLDANVAVSSEGACNAVEARGWHPLAVRAQEARVDAATNGRRATIGIDAADVGGERVRLLSGGVAQSAAQLEAAAKAHLTRLRAGEVTFSGLAAGDPLLSAGTPVDVSGLPATLCGRYVLHAVDHVIDQYRGYLCELSSTPLSPDGPQPGVGRATRTGCQSTLGVVTAVGDPEGRGRVKVALPALGDVGDIESGWLQVLSAGAGAGKGLTMLPGVDDTVLVLLPLEDPSQGIVLGGLFGEPGTTDPGVAGGRVQRYTFLSPAGQRVVLDDETGTLSVDDGRGSRLELSAERVRLIAAAELELEAAAGVRIKGRTVDFEKV